MEHRAGWRGTVIEILDETRPRNPDFVVVWDESWNEYLKAPEEMDYVDFCLGRYLRLAPPIERSELQEDVSYDS